MKKPVEDVAVDAIPPFDGNRDPMEGLANVREAPSTFDNKRLDLDVAGWAIASGGVSTFLFFPMRLHLTPPSACCLHGQAFIPFPTPHFIFGKPSPPLFHSGVLGRLCTPLPLSVATSCLIKCPLPPSIFSSFFLKLLSPLPQPLHNLHYFYISPLPSGPCPSLITSLSCPLLLLSPHHVYCYQVFHSPGCWQGIYP